MTWFRTQGLNEIPPEGQEREDDLDQEALWCSGVLKVSCMIAQTALIAELFQSC